jgi:hypothetical protein
MDYQKVLMELAPRFQGFEIVPGVGVSPPCFSGPWPARQVEALASLVTIPPAYRKFLCSVGSVSASDVAGGVAFLEAAQVDEHLRQAYGVLLRVVDGVSVFPFAVNGSGSYILLSCDDKGVWIFNAHMHPVSKPRRIAGSFEAFVEGMISDWEAVLRGEGGPYSTS